MTLALTTWNLTSEQLYEKLSSLFPTAETDWSGHEKLPAPPFAVYSELSPFNVKGDNKVLHSYRKYRVELYIEKTDYESEAKLEALFDENDLYWDKDRNWNRELGLYQITYEI